MIPSLIIGLHSCSEFEKYIPYYKTENKAKIFKEDRGRWLTMYLNCERYLR